MTDRVRTLTVELNGEIRDEDAEAIMDAIRMVKGVLDVRLGPVCDAASWAAHRAAVREIDEVLREAIAKLYGVGASVRAHPTER